jgi:hypothetical protein
MRPTKTTISVTSSKKTCRLQSAFYSPSKEFLDEHDRRVNKGRHAGSSQRVVTGKDWVEVTKL